MAIKSTRKTRKSCRRCFSKLPRKRLQSWWQQSIHTIWNGFSEYSERSTIHGVRYLGERKRLYIEKIYWIVAFTICAALSGKFVNEVRWRWKYSPEIITYADEAIPVSQIPFPTITICSHINVQKSVYENIYKVERLLLEVYYTEKNETDFSEEIMQSIQSLYVLYPFCRGHPKLIEMIDHLNIFIDRNIFPYLTKLAENLFELESLCMMYETHFQCKEIFTPILMNGELCYTFNQMGSTEMYKSNSLADNFPFVEPFHYNSDNDSSFGIHRRPVKLHFPYHAKNHKDSFILHMTWPKYRSEVKRCGGIEDTKNWKIFLHAANEMPYVMSTSFDIPVNQEVHLVVNPNVKRTDESAIAYYAIDDRKCIAEQEHDLKFFKKYSQSYCRAEEMIENFFEECDCVYFWMPRLNDSKVCDDYCVELKNNYQNAIPNVTKCLPACNTISYDTEMSTKKMNFENDDGFSKKFDTLYVMISFKIEKTIAWRQSGMYGFGLLNFLASCGGILGLFMGVSVLSILEIIYSFTLRAYCNFRREKLKKKNLLVTLEQSENAISTIKIADV